MSGNAGADVTLVDLLDAQRRMLAVVEAQAARIDLLEHALHETRQRADRLADVIWETTKTFSSRIWGDDGLSVGTHSESPGDRDRRLDQRYGVWWSRGLADALDLFDAHDLEPHHFERQAPEWGPDSHDEAQLAGARARFERRDEIRAGELR